MKDPGLTFNEDTNHFYIVRSAEEMSEEHIREFVAQYADTSVSRIVFSVNGMRTSFPSEVWEHVLDLPDSAADGVPFGELLLRSLQNFRLLAEKEIDPYAIWLDQCRASGLAGWLSTRMNDSHCTDDPDHFFHATFWREHPEYWRFPHAEGPALLTDRSLDWAHEAVRERHMLLIEELFERYDFDGLELDWMRFGFHFRPGHEHADAPLLTEFTARVRQLARDWSKRRGHPIGLSARVPTWPTNSQDLGMDAIEWARRDLVDELVLSPFWATADFAIPISLWRDVLGDAAERVTLSACLERRLMGRPTSNDVHCTTTPETVRGFAASVVNQGAAVYLFNHMDRAMEGPEEELWEIYRDAGDRSALAAKPRRHVVTFTDHTPPGAPTPHALPQEIGPVLWAMVRIDSGAAPRNGAATFRVGLAPREDVDAVAFEARINGEACSPAADHDHPDEFPGAVRVVQFDVPLAALADGQNVLAIRLAEDGPDHEAVWAELAITPQA